MIYPLEHTDIALSGQVKLNIYLNKDGEHIYTSDIKISPVSDNIPFTYDLGERDILNTHTYNIQKLRTELGDTFYDTMPYVRSNYYLPEGVALKDTFDCQYEAGIHRASYKKYGRQIMVFFPIWVDGDIDDLFDGLYIGLNGYEEKIDFTDDLKKYFREMFYEKMSDDSYNKTTEKYLMNIDLSKFTAYIYGTDIDDGIDKKVDISDIVKNLRDRERPLLEQNNLITSQFKANHLITKQLVNLNFVIDPYDVINEFIGPKVGEDINISVVYKHNGENVKSKDFYFNQAEIPNIKLTNAFKTEIVSNESIFTTSHEDFVYDFAFVNKLIPTTLHWSCFLTEPRLFNLCSDYAYMDNDGNKSIYPPFTSNFYSKEDTVFNNIYCFCDTREWPLDEEGVQLDYTRVTTLLGENILNLMGDDIVAGSNFNPKYSTKISEDYIFNGNSMPKVQFPNGVKAYMRIRIYNSEEDIFDLYESVNDNGKLLYYTLIISTAKINKILNWNAFCDLLCSKEKGKTFVGWYDSVVESNKMKSMILKKSFVSKIHPCSEKELISYDLYKNDSVNIILNRYDGNISPLLIDTDNDLLFNRYYRYRRIEDINSYDYFGKHLYPQYVKGDKFFALQSMSRNEYLEMCSNIPEMPMLNTGTGKVRYLLPEYNINIDYSEGFNENNPLKPIEYLAEKKKLGDYAKNYNFNIISLDEKLDKIDGNNIIKYKYTVKYELK